MFTEYYSTNYDADTSHVPDYANSVEYARQKLASYTNRFMVEVLNNRNYTTFLCYDFYNLGTLIITLDANTNSFTIASFGTESEMHREGLNYIDFAGVLDSYFE